MHRRTFFLLLALVLLVGLATHAFARSFVDVQGTAYEAAYADLSDHGALQGYSDGTGRPNTPLNRVEAIKVALSLRDEHQSRVQKMQGRLPPIPLFIDIEQSAWYAPFVEVAFERGIITGYPDGTLRPGQLLRVEEAAQILMRVYGLQGTLDTALSSQYIQNQDNEWFTPSINAAIERNLIMHRGTLRLGTAITRGQFFDMAYRLRQVKIQGLTAFSGPEPVVEPPPQQVTRVIVPTVRSPAVTPRPVLATSRPVPSSPPTAQVSTTPSVGPSEEYFAISMPSVDITDLPITHPEDPFSSDGLLSILQHGVGHLFSYPGGGGKIMIYGHSSSYAWDVSEYTKIFRGINQLNPGDKVYVTYKGKLYTYEVTHEQTVQASDTSALQDDGSGEELILYTCWPPDSISQRYLVHARPVNPVAAR